MRRNGGTVDGANWRMYGDDARTNTKFHSEITYMSNWKEQWNITST
jgi:hypothetical protein